jgi:phage tail tape-measure protein
LQSGRFGGRFFLPKSNGLTAVSARASELVMHAINRASKKEKIMANESATRERRKSDQSNATSSPAFPREAAGAVAGAVVGSVAGPVGVVIGGVVGAIASHRAGRKTAKARSAKKSSGRKSKTTSAAGTASRKNSRGQAKAPVRGSTAKKKRR